MRKGALRIVLIGPVVPFRGGIAQHTTMVHRALAEGADLLTLSFSRQYPRVLFPGESDREPGMEGHKEPGVGYIVDSVNPLTWRRAVKRAVAFGPAAVVIPWWTVFWAPCFGWMARRLAKAGVPVVFLCHNVVEHESAGWKARLARGVLAQGSGFVVHTREDEANLKAFLPNARVARHHHPVYEQFPDAKGTLPRRAALELLFFGFVRPYKGLDVLVEAMGQLAGRDIKLTIAGEFWEGDSATRQRVEELGIGSQVEIVSRYLPDEEVAELFARADLVVLPYRSATGSGVVALAYHYGKPVIVTRVGGLPDVVLEGRTGFVVAPESPEAVAEAILRFDAAPPDGMADAIAGLRATMTWESFADSIVGLVNGLE